MYNGNKNFIYEQQTFIKNKYIYMWLLLSNSKQQQTVTEGILYTGSNIVY
jgi:hypothetical protein